MGAARADRPSRERQRGGDVTFWERQWEKPWGWLLPFGAAWKLGRRHAGSPRRDSWLMVLLVWDAMSVRIYERGRTRTLQETRPEAVPD